MSAYEMCPYRFFLKYLYCCEEKPKFFSQYGEFVHQIHQLVFSSLLKRQYAAQYYVRYFMERVTEKAPTQQIFLSYFRSGLTYFENMPEFEGSPLGIEKEFRFEIDGFPFVGYADLLTKSDGIILYDHKARTLKPRSNRKKPTLTDQELDRYFRQLYLYSIPIQKEYGEYPKKLVFNCYRAGYFIEEPFDIEKLDAAKLWALNTINEIISTQDWPPSIEAFRCKNLCGVEDNCSYFDLL